MLKVRYTEKSKRQYFPLGLKSVFEKDIKLSKFSVLALINVPYGAQMS